MSMLRPCPFCGYELLGSWGRQVLCPNCGAEGPDKVVAGNIDERWNTRKADAEVAKLRRDIVDALCWAHNQVGSLAEQARFPGVDAYGALLGLLQVINNKIESAKAQIEHNGSGCPPT